MLLQEIFLTFQPLRPFLVASEHPVGEKPVSGTHRFRSILIVECWMWCVSLTVRSAKLQRLKISKTATLDTFPILYMYMYNYVYQWWLLSKGAASFQVLTPLPPPPPNETLIGFIGPV